MKSIDSVLIVEDNETDRYVLERRLRRSWPDIDVLVASDGRAAIELLEMPGQAMPDMIFLDINMPRMDGHEFLETYYGEAGRRIPVVMMLTSSEHDRDQERASRFECVKVFAKKPIQQEVIDGLLEQLEP